MRPEDEFKHKHVRPALKTVKKCWYFLNESRLSIRGLPDIVGIVNGRFFAWEIKHSEQEGLKTTGRIVLQRYIINTIIKCGGVGRIVYPENLDECLQELINLNK